MRKKKEEDSKLKTAGKYGLAAGAGIGAYKVRNSNTVNYVRSGIQNRVGNNGLVQAATQDYNSVVRPAKEGLMRNKTVSSAVDAVTTKKGAIRGGLRKTGARALKGLRKTKVGRKAVGYARTGLKAVKPYSGIAKAGLGGMALYGAYRLLKKKKRED